MPQLIHILNQILLTQKLITENPLNFPLEIVHENMGAAGFLTPRQHRRREDRRHSPWICSRIPARPVDENHVPGDLVNVVWQIVDSELAFREEEILNGSAISGGLCSRLREKLSVLAHFCCELNVVGFDAGVGLLEFGDGVLVLVEENGAAIVVECGPEEGLVGEAEDEEVGTRWGAEEGGCDGVDFGRGHGFSGGGVEGGVVEEGSGDGRWEGRGGACGGGSGGGDGGGDEGEG